MSDIDQAIAQYRKQLVAEAELADGDLAEIEDHLRTLTGDLRDGGMPAAQAVTEAARRLGDPTQVAREHARVRSPFGAKLSRARAWSAAALLAPPIVLQLIDWLPYGLDRQTLELVVGAVLAIALVMRLSWARPIALGGMAFFLFPTLMAVHNDAMNPAWLAWHVGVIAFLAPWRRSEMRGAGWSLALQVWSYGCAAMMIGFQYGTRDGVSHSFELTSRIVMLCSTIAVVGGILRARWGALASASSALVMWSMAIQLWTFHAGLGIAHRELMSLAMDGFAFGGAIAATIATFLAVRTARSNFGTLRHVLR